MRKKFVTFSCKNCAFGILKMEFSQFMAEKWNLPSNQFYRTVLFPVKLFINSTVCTKQNSSYRLHGILHCHKINVPCYRIYVDFTVNVWWHRRATIKRYEAKFFLCSLFNRFRVIVVYRFASLCRFQIKSSFLLFGEQRTKMKLLQFALR